MGVSELWSDCALWSQNLDWAFSPIVFDSSTPPKQSGLSYIMVYGLVVTADTQLYMQRKKWVFLNVYRLNVMEKIILLKLNITHTVNRPWSTTYTLEWKTAVLNASKSLLLWNSQMKICPLFSTTVHLKSNYLTKRENLYIIKFRESKSAVLLLTRLQFLMPWKWHFSLTWLQCKIWMCRKSVWSVCMA